MKEKMKEILKQSTVLLVEDDLKTRAQIEEALYIYVDKVYLASNGEEALKIYYEKSPHIVITDVKMPIMDGLSLTSVIRNSNPDIPIVIVSGYSDRTLLLDFISKKLISYMVKPINFDDFTKVLDECAKALQESGAIEVWLTDGFLYSYSKKSIMRGDEIISLAPKEILFLELLIKNRNKLVTKEIIEYIVWNSEVMTGAALNNLVAKIRRKTFSGIITNVSTLGFMMTKV